MSTSKTFRKLKKKALPLIDELTFEKLISSKISKVKYMTATLRYDAGADTFIMKGKNGMYLWKRGTFTHDQVNRLWLGFAASHN